MKKLSIVLAALILAGCPGIAYAPGPAPSMGNEIGVLDAQVVEEVQRLFEESGIPSLAYKASQHRQGRKEASHEKQ